MRVPKFATFLICWLTGANVSADECPISLPDKLGLPMKLESPEGFAWVGTPRLAARVPEHGHWTAMGPAYDYRDKWWWWREGYRAKDEERPNLVITARRLDGEGPSVHRANATNAFGPGWDLMLVGMEFPSPGCWEVIGRYHGQELRFVFRVGS